MLELKHACVAAEWELVGGASSSSEMLRQLEEWRPDVLVIDAGLGEGAIARARSVRPGIRVVSLGALAGADEVAASLVDLRPSILGLPRPGGPVL
jgi:DNA-binding NarL/FixJ family response regulator